MVKDLYKHKKLDFMKGTLSWLSIILHWIEILIAIVVIIFVMYSIFAMTQHVTYESLTGGDFYHTFENILSDILLIIIGVELAILLIRRSPESLVEVMFFVVARKLLVKSHTQWDILIGVAAIAGLFAVRKYLEHTTPERQLLEVHIPKK